MANMDTLDFSELRVKPVPQAVKATLATKALLVRLARQVPKATLALPALLDKQVPKVQWVLAATWAPKERPAQLAPPVQLVPTVQLVPKVILAKLA
jgi:hypothetical protein